MRITVGITGASGSIYGYTLVRMLAQAGTEVSVILTEMGEKVLAYECGVTADELSHYASIHDNKNLFSSLASGSVHTDGMVIAPCSMNTLGSISSGAGDTLLTRSASVAMKERRPLILLVRETPYSTVHLRNMYELSRFGVCILPASPAFYTRPTQVWELVQGIVVRMMDQLGLETPQAKRWEGSDRS